MTGSAPCDRHARDDVQETSGDPKVAERAFLRRRAFQEIGFAIGAKDRTARIPHDHLAQAYCMRCRAIRDPAECEICALREVCQRLAGRFAE